MSHEASLRAAFDTFNEHGLLAAEDLWHPDVEYHEAPDFPGAGTYQGRDAVAARFAEYLEVLGDDTRAVIERVVERGDEAVWIVRFTGRTSEGLPHDHAWGYVGRFEDGRVREVHAHYNPEDALAALTSPDP